VNLTKSDLSGTFALFRQALRTLEHARSAIAARPDGDHLAIDDGFDLSAPGASGLHPLGEVAIDDRDSAAVRLGFSQFPHDRYSTEHPFALQVTPGTRFGQLADAAVGKRSYSAAL
jgi:hypothetical protein